MLKTGNCSLLVCTVFLCYVIIFLCMVHYVAIVGYNNSVCGALSAGVHVNMCDIRQ